MKRYLIVDDDADIRAIAEDAGHVAKASVNEALEYLELMLINVDTIILDVVGVGELHSIINMCKEKNLDILLTTGGSTAAAKFGKAIAANKNIRIYDKIDALDGYIEICTTCSRPFRQRVDNGECSSCWREYHSE